jgi:hypothetical protein
VSASSAAGTHAITTERAANCKRAYWAREHWDEPDRPHRRSDGPPFVRRAAKYKEIGRDDARTPTVRNWPSALRERLSWPGVLLMNGRPQCRSPLRHCQREIGRVARRVEMALAPLRAKLFERFQGRTRRGEPVGSVPRQKEEQPNCAHDQSADDQNCDGGRHWRCLFQELQQATPQRPDRPRVAVLSGADQGTRCRPARKTTRQLAGEPFADAGQRAEPP